MEMRRAGWDQFSSNRYPPPGREKLPKTSQAGEGAAGDYAGGKAGWVVQAGLRKQCFHRGKDF
jgi:hypothetical protein